MYIFEAISNKFRHLAVRLKLLPPDNRPPYTETLDCGIDPHEVAIDAARFRELIIQYADDDSVTSDDIWDTVEREREQREADDAGRLIVPAAIFNIPSRSGYATQPIEPPGREHGKEIITPEQPFARG